MTKESKQEARNMEIGRKTKKSRKQPRLRQFDPLLRCYVKSLDLPFRYPAAPGKTLP
jgi:hypothetical protein